LPIGVRAIVTSRRGIVRRAIYPIDLGPFAANEVSEFIESLSSLPGFAYASAFSPDDKERIGVYCDRIPLAIRWVLGRSCAGHEALN